MTALTIKKKVKKGYRNTMDEDAIAIRVIQTSLDPSGDGIEPFYQG
jgi:hypothetical protein